MSTLAPKRSGGPSEQPHPRPPGRAIPPADNDNDNDNTAAAAAAAGTDTDTGEDAPFRWAPLLVVLAGTFMTFLDFFIVNVALPDIHDELQAGPGAVQLVVAGYGLFFAAGMISGGRLGDLYGRRRLFTVGLALFTLTSAACGLAPNTETLVAARMLQGVAGALVTPQVLAIIGTIYAERHRSRAFAGYGFAMGIAGVLGQLVGGALIQADLAGSGWRGIFLINIPVGLITLPFVHRVVPESHGTPARLDLGGTALVVATVTAVVLPLVEGRGHGWPAWSWLCLGAAPLVAAAFVGHQLRRRRAGRAPLVDLGLFRGASFRLGSLTALTFALVPPSFFFVLALYMQQGRGFSPLFSGVVFVAVGVGYFAALIVAGPLAARLGRQVLALGALVVSAGCLLLAGTAHASSSLDLVPGLAVIGFGIGAVLVPLTATVLSGVDPLHAGAASGVLATAQQVGGALGIAVIGVVFYDALDGGTSSAGAFTHAFRLSLYVLAGLTLATAALVQVLPHRPEPAAGGSA